MSLQRYFRVKAPDGVMLDALTQGPQHKRPFLFLHGLSDSRLSFGPLLSALPETIHAVTVSQRGHGASDKPEDPSAYCARRFSDDVFAVLDTVGHDQATLVGHSLGAWAALHAALGRRDRVSRLILIGAFSQFEGNPSVASLIEEIGALSDPVDPAFVRGFQEAASSRDLPAEFFETVVAESLRLPAYVWNGVSAAFMTDDVPRNLAAIRAPTQLIWGDRDPFASREDQESLRKRITGATLHVCEGLGHSPHWDRPGMVAQLLVGEPASQLQMAQGAHDD
jgi:non-heme chloroperoxidase